MINSAFELGFNTIDEALSGMIMTNGLEQTVKTAKMGLEKLFELKCDGEYSRGMATAYSEFLSRHTDGIEI